jgi:ferritin-like metal-binding protein YciE
MLESGGADVTRLQKPFIAMLREQLYTEQELVQTLPTLISEASDDELQKNLEHHLEETQQQVGRLEDALQQLGEKATPKKSPVMDSLKQVHEELSSEADDNTRDVVVAAAAASTEHYEISVYEAGIEVAQAAGASEVAKLLKESLKEEEAALGKAQQAVKKLTEEHAGQLTR